MTFHILPKARLSINIFLNTFCLIFLMTCAASASWAQNTRISASGQTGTSGTNWTTSGTNPVTITVSGGAANIHPDVITGYLNSGISVIVQDNRCCDTRIEANILKSSGGAATLTFKDNSGIEVGDNVSITSNVGVLNLILWADIDNGPGTDYIMIRPGANISTNGGYIVMGGGLDDGSNGGIANDGIPDGFAVNGSSEAAGGVNIGPPGGTGTVISISTNGGDILLRGRSLNSSTHPGITSQGSFKMDSGTGKITMFGTSGSGHGIELTYAAVPTIAITSGSTQTPAIEIKGTTSAFTGFFTSNSSSGNFLIQSIAATGGGVTIEGSGNNNGVYFGNSGSNTVNQILSAAGPIQIKGKGGGSNPAIVFYGESYVGTRFNTTPVHGITPAVASTAANITLEADGSILFSNTSGKNANFQSTGALAIKSYTSNFAGTINFQGNSNFVPGFSSITLGENSGNYSITQASALSSVGDITAWANDYTQNGNLTTTGSGSGIFLRAKGNIASTASVNITTNNGPVVLAADRDATGGGVVQYGETLNITSTGGAVTIGGGNEGATEYAQGYNGGNLRNSGVRFKTLNIQSGGGDVNIRGKSFNATIASGVGAWGIGVWDGNFTINSGTGKIYMEGISQSIGTNSLKGGIMTNGAVNLESAFPGADAIKLLGSNTTTGPGWNHGVDLGSNSESDGSGTQRIVATGTGGGVIIEGTANEWSVLIRRSTELLANGGDIVLKGIPNSAATPISKLFLRNANNHWWGSKASSAVTGTNSNILIEFNDFDFAGFPKFATTGAVTLQPASTSFTRTINTGWFSWNQNSQTMSAFNFGKSGNTSGLLHDIAAISVTGPINFYGAALTINQGLTATNNNINLFASGAVTQGASGALIANGLGLNGVGPFTLTNTSNNIATIAGGASDARIGNLSLVDASGGLTIGTVNPTGISSSGVVLIETLTGDITLSENISTTNTSATAITLNAGKSKSPGDATGGNILVSGSPTLTTGTGGIVRLFSGSESGSTGLSDLATTPANVLDNVDETTTFSPALSANNTYALYRYGLGSLGDLTVVASGGDAQGTTWDYDSGILRPTGIAAARVNASVLETYLASGDLTVHGGRVFFSASVNSTSANNLKVWSNTHISNTVATVITTQGGDVLLASNVNDATDAESTTNGYIQFRLGLTITTNGGDITIGGGNTSGSEYAHGSSAEHFTEGVRVDLVFSLNSGGGDIIMKGKSYARSVSTGLGASGVGIYFTTGAGTINSGAGTITIDGSSQTSGSTFSSGIYASSTLNITSANTTANAIRLFGSATGNGGDEAWGIETEGVFTVMATGAGGGITLSTSQQNTNNNYDAVFRAQTNFLANGGPINLLGGQSGGITNGRWFINADFYIGSKAGTAVPSSASDIVIQYDRFIFNNFRPYVATSGTVTLQSVGNSFGSGVNTNWFRWNENSQTMSGLTIGKINNNTDIVHEANAITVAGPITFNSLWLYFRANLTSTTASDISLNARGNFDNDGTTRRTITTAGGNIMVYADSDANGGGVLSVDHITFNPGAGETRLRGETFGWDTGSNSVKPWINGTGNFIFESSDASFGQGVNTTWFFFDQDANGIGAITIGKSTNNYTVSIDGAAISAAGPLSAYGFNIASSASVTLSTGGALLKATNNISVTGNYTTSGGNVVLWADSDGTSEGVLEVKGNITTNGGHIYGGGGSTSEMLNGVEVPSGSAFSNSTAYHGLYVDGCTVNSGGGDIRFKGTARPINGYLAGISVRNASIQSGAGDLSLYGRRIGDPDASAGLWLGSTIATGTASGNVSISSTSGDIYLEGISDATVGYSWNHGLAIVSAGGDDITISSTSGNIVMLGDALGASARAGEAVGMVLQTNSTSGLIRINTDGGSISITGKSADANDDFGMAFRAANLAGNITIGDANTGDVTLRFGSLQTTAQPVLGVVSIQSAGDYVLEGVEGNAFGAAINLTDEYAFGTSGTSLRVGSTTNTRNITIGASPTIAGPIAVYGGNLTVNGVVTATNDNIQLHATGAATQGSAGGLVANGLGLNGAGTFNLTSNNNNVITIAGGSSNALLGSVAFTDASGGLTIGTVNPTGIHSTGAVTIETLTGNINLEADITTASTSTSAIVLNAGKSKSIGDPTGGDILVSGSPMLTTGTGGIVRLFSGSEANSTGLTTLAGGSANTRDGVDETTTTFTPALSAGTTYALYRFSLNALGDLTIVNSGGDALNTTWTYESGMIRPTGIAAARVNASVVNDYLASGELTIRAGNITFSANVTGSSHDFRVLSNTHITNSVATVITMQGGDVLLVGNVNDAVDGESTTNGFVQFRGGLTITTNGGDITIGGGNASGTDYATGSSAENAVEGVRIDQVLSLNSGGGDITIRGKSYARSVQTAWGACGVGFFVLTGTGIINSGSGKITIDGYSQTTTSSFAAGIYMGSAVNIISDNTNPDAIRLIGTATGTSGEAWGIETEGVLTVMATGSGGGITLATSQKNTNNNYDAVFRAQTNFLANGGPINLLGGQSGGIANGRWFIRGDSFIGSKAGSAVTTSSSNILLEFDRYDVDVFRYNIATTGTVTWHSASNSFGQSVYTTWFRWNQNSQTMSGLTIGKTNNNTDIVHETNAITVAGPITFNALWLYFRADLTSTTASDISLNARGNFDNDGTTRRTITTAGGNIMVYADSDASGGGVLSVDYITFNPGAGETRLRGETFSWNFGSNTVKPWINGTGNFVFESSDASFGQGVNTTWFFFDQDANGIGAITIGKSTNNYTVSIDGAAISAAGPLSAYGFNIASSASVTLSTGGALLKAANDISVTGNYTTSGGDVVVWSDSDASGTATSPGGYIYVTSTINTNGGDIVMAGGAEVDGLPGGYAIGQLLLSTTTCGMIIKGGVLNAGSGNVTLRAQGTGNNADYQEGMWLDNGSITGADITIDAIGSIRGGSSSNWGLEINKFNITGSGAISLTGRGGRAGSSNQDTNQRGVYVYNNSLVQATGSGTITITGIGGGGTFSGSNPNANNPGIFLNQTNAALSTAGGTITLNGTSGHNGRGNGVNINAPITTNGDLIINAFKSTSGTVANGNISITSAITANGADIKLNSPGAVTQSAGIVADGLALEGEGTFTLTNTSNNVATIAGGTVETSLGSLSFTDASGGLTIGTVNPTGIHSTGAVLIETLTGNINLEADITTTNTSSTAIVLNAGKSKSIGDPTGGDILVVGSPVLTTGAGGIARLFSGRETNSTGLNTLVGGTANVREGVDETTTTFSPALSGDNKYALYRFSLSNLGDLTIVDSGGNAFNSTWTVESGMLRPIGSAAASVNAADVVTYLGLGDLEIRAGNITVNGSITTGSTNHLTLKTNGNIIHNAAKTFTGGGGDLVYWADLDGASGGYIDIAGSILTNGGNFYAGGGAASETIGSVTVPSGNANSITDTKHGINVRGGTINSNGGDIRLKGSGTAVNGDVLGLAIANASIQSGDGDITLYGIRSGDPKRGAGVWIGTTFLSGVATGNVNITSTGGNITIEGISQASASFENNHGLSFQTVGTDDITIASGTGNISIIGNSSAAAAQSGEAVGIVLGNATTGGTISITTDGGTITMSGTGANNSEDYGMSLRAADAVGNITIGDANTGDVTLNFDYLSRSALSTLGVTNINSGGAISVQPIGADWGANLHLYDELSFGSNATSLTIGPATGTKVLDMSATANIAGPITLYGGRVVINADLTSSATGDIFIQSNNSENNSVYLAGKTITKSGGTGTLTMKGKARVNADGPITTSGTGVLNVVLWADYDGSNNDGGVSGIKNISTNGGHVWIGGTGTSNGSDTWNGLTVGNGPSRGSTNFNNNPIDFSGNITTNGGDILMWAGQGVVFNGIAHGNQTLNSGSGDITLISNNYSSSNALTINSTGHLTIRPNTNAWEGVGDQMDLTGSLNSNNFVGSGDASWLKINGVSSLGGLTLGHPTSTSYIRTYTPWSIAGPITIYAPKIDIDANLTATGGNILLDADNGTPPNAAEPGILLDNAVTISTVSSGDITMIAKSGTGLAADAIDASAATAVTIQSAGNLTMEGYGNGTGASNGIDLNNDVFSAAGAVSFVGKQGTTSGAGIILAGTTSVTGAGVNMESLTDATDKIQIAGTASISGGAQTVALKTANLDLPGTGTRSITTTGSVSIVPDVDQASFATAINTQYLNIVNSTGLTIGKSTNTANITIGRATTVTGPVTLYGGTLAINGTLTATGDDINLHASTGASQTAGLIADGLGLHGAVNYSLTNAANNVATLAGGSATTKLSGLTFLDASGGLTIGTVNPTGITSVGPVLIETTTGDITLSANITTDDATANAIVLNAGKSKNPGDETGGDIKISGTPVLTTGAGGIVKLFSGSEDNSTGLTDFVTGPAYKRNFVDETTASFSPVLTAGNQYALYRAGCTVGLASSNPTLCEGTSIPLITFTTTLVTGIGTPSGLPSGVTAFYNTSTAEVEVSGTPTEPGVFNYQIPLTGACGASMAIGTITVKSAPTAAISLSETSGNANNDGEICDGSSAVLTASGGATYAWSNNSATTPTVVVQPTATSTYTVTVTASNGCTDTEMITIQVNPTPNPMITSADPDCPAAMSGTATATVDLSWTYLWSDGQTSSTATGLTEGLYTLTVTDVNGCTATNSVTLVSIGLMVNTVTETDVKCYGDNTGAIEVSATGGMGPYTFMWSPNAGSVTTTTVSGLPAGTYTVTVTESGTNSCTAVKTFEIMQPEHPVIATITVDENSGLVADDGTICIGDNAGLTANATASMGRTIASYLWDDSASSTTSGITVSTGAAFTVIVTDDIGCTATVTSTVTVEPLNTVSPATDNPTVCFNELLTPNVTHSTTGATGIGFATGLPFGLSASWATNTITISGTALERGIFNYSIPLSGGCGTFNATGIITVSATNTVSAASSSPVVCFNEAMPDVTFNTVGATGIGTPTGLPIGVTASWTGDVITVSGTPVQAGTFNYTIPLTGGCGIVNATGMMTVTASNTVSFLPGTVTECINELIPPIVFTTTGATGIGSASGLPPGLSASWSANTISISGSPTSDGMFTFSIPLSGGCGLVTATGTVNIISTNSASAPSIDPSVCINSPIPSVTITTVGAAGISNDGVAGANGLPPGVSATWATDIITLSGAPTMEGVFNYSIPLTGGCGMATANGTVTVYNEPMPSISISNPNHATAVNLCEDTEVTLTVSGLAGNTYVWTVTGTATGTVSMSTPVSGTVGGGLVTFKYTPTTTGDLTFTYTEEGSGGCTGTSSVMTTVLQTNPLLGNIQISNPANATANNLCNLETITLTGASSAPGVTYQWAQSGTSSGSFSATNTASVMFTPGTIGTLNFTFTAIESNGCTVTSTASSLVYPAKPTVTLAITDNPNNPTLANLCTGMADMALEATGTINALSATYSWNKSGAGATASFIDPQFGTFSSPLTMAYNPSTTGQADFTITLTDNNGCYATSPVLSTTVFPGVSTPGPIEVAVAPLLTPPSTPLTQMCTSGNYNLLLVNESEIISGGAGTIQSQWGQTTSFGTYSSGGTTTGPAVYRPHTATGALTLTYTASNTNGGCFATTELSGLSVATSTLLATLSPSNSKFCTGSALAMSANQFGGVGPYTYLWAETTSGDALGSFTVTSTANTTFLLGMTPGNAEVSMRVTDAVGCPSVAAATVEIAPQVEVFIRKQGETTAATTADVCFGSTLTLQAVAGGGGMVGAETYAYSWELINPLGSASSVLSAAIGTSAGPHTVTFTPPASAVDGSTFRLRVMAEVNVQGRRASCYDYSEEIEITVRKIAAATLSLAPMANTQVCTNGTTELIINVDRPSGGSNTYNFAYSVNGMGSYSVSALASGTSSVTTIPLGSLGTNTITLANAGLITDGNGCAVTGTGSAVVQVVSAPTVALPADQTVCKDAIVMLSPTVSGGIAGVNLFTWENSYNGSGFLPVNSTATQTANTSVGGVLDVYRVVVQQGSASLNCISSLSTPSTVTVVPDPTISVAPVDITQCVGGSAMLQVTAIGGAPSLNYQWQMSTSSDFSDVTDIGTDAASYLPESSEVGNTYYRVVVSAPGADCQTATSTIAEVTIVADPSIALQPESFVQCVGGTLALNAAGEYGTPFLTYQWETGTTSTGTFTPIAGEVSTVYTPLSAVPGTNYYRLVASASGNGCTSANSDIVEVIVVADPVAPTLQTATPTTSAAPTQVCVGQALTASFNAGDLGVGTCVDEYRFVVTNDIITSRVITEFTGDFAYTIQADEMVEVQTRRDCDGPACDGNGEIWTTVAAWTAIAPAVSTAIPSASTICQAAPATISATVTGGVGGYANIWQFSADGTTWTDIANGTPAGAIYSGESTTALSLSGIREGGDYQYRLKAYKAGCTSVEGEGTTLTVIQLAEPGNQAITICSETVVGDYLPAGFVLPTVGTTTWAWTMGALPTGVTVSAGSTSGTGTSINTEFLNLNNFARNVVFTVVPTTTANTLACAAVPFTVTVTVNPTPVLTGVNPNGPLTLCAGESRFVAAASITNSPRFTWSIIAGTASGITLNDQPVSIGAGYVVTDEDYVELRVTGSGTLTLQVVAGDAAGCPPSGNPSSLVFTVASNPSSAVLIAPNNDVNPCTGTTKTYAVSGVQGRTYQWSLSSGGTFVSAPSSSSVMVSWAAPAGSVHTLTLTESVGNCTSSTPFIVTIATQPTITTQPVAETICTGGTFSALAVTGANLVSPVYQWYLNGSAIPGATSSSYTPTVSTVNTAASPVVYNYYVVITNSGSDCASVQSNTVALTVTPSVLTEAGGDLSTCAGSPVVLSGASISHLGVSYSGTWSIAGGGLGTLQNAGSVSGAIYIAPEDAPDGTQVTLILTSDNPGMGCSATSDTRVVTISNPTLGISVSDLAVCLGSSVTLTGSLSGAWTNPSVTWISEHGTFSDANALVTVFTPSALGSATVRLTGSDDFCDIKSVTIVLTVGEGPEVTVTANSTVCAGSDVPVSAVISGSINSGTWSSGGSGTFADASALSTLYTPSMDDVMAGTVTLTFTTSDPTGSCSPGSGAATVQIGQIPTPSIQITNNNACAFADNNIITFTATGGSGVFTSNAPTGSFSSNGNTAELNIREACAGDFTVTFTVTDGGCTASSTVTATVLNCGVEVSGQLRFVDNQNLGVANAIVTLREGATVLDTDISTGSGSYMVSWPSGTTFTVSATKNRSWANGAASGVTSADASRILQHVGALPSNQLTTAYKRIAADIDGNNIINSADASLVTQALTNNLIAQFRFTSRSWVFVPQSQTLTAATWNTYQTNLTITDPCDLANANFIGIKLGDVQTPVANPGLGFTYNEDRDLGWMVTDVVLNEGAEIVAEFRAMGIDALMAYQFALGFDTEKLAFLGVEQVSGSPITPAFGTVAGGVLRTAFAAGQGMQLISDTPVFRIRFRVLEGGGMLSQALEIDETAMEPEAYTTNAYHAGAVNLWFTTMTQTEESTNSGLSLFQNRPNPFKGKTTIGYVVPEHCDVRLRIYEASGKMIAEQKAWSAVGYQEMEFNLEEYSGAGVLYYELVTPFGSLTKKMVITRK